jgi:hypothetical protein
VLSRILDRRLRFGHTAILLDRSYRFVILVGILYLSLVPSKFLLKLLKLSMFDVEILAAAEEAVSIAVVIVIVATDELLQLRQFQVLLHLVVFVKGLNYRDNVLASTATRRAAGGIYPIERTPLRQVGWI